MIVAGAVGKFDNKSESCYNTCIDTEIGTDMNEKQLAALFDWLDHQTYSGEPGTDGEYVRMEEMRMYLPEAIKKIMEQE